MTLIIILVMIILQQIKKEFCNFRGVMAENEWITKQAEIEMSGIRDCGGDPGMV